MDLLFCFLCDNFGQNNNGRVIRLQYLLKTKRR